MTTLGKLAGSSFTTSSPGPVDPSLFALITGQPAPLDLNAIVADLVTAHGMIAAAALGPTALSVRASLEAWIYQDDDAHEPCSLTACRAPLHPGPCKGWKGTLHAVAPGTYKQIEDERVAKANARRLKRIADLKAQGKPIPRKLLAEIKAKPAPGTGVGGAAATPLGKVNQQADLAGGQAHAASQAINKAAGITQNTAPLPTGPKGKKPSVAGRGPAFVITQPKVTDQYKLDKAAKLTPTEWNALSPGDKKLIRDELEAIKVRGFGPQQTKADALLAQLPAASTLGTSTGKPTPAAPSAPQAPSATPGKTTLGQATKAVPAPAPTAAGPQSSRSQASSALAVTTAIVGPQTADPAQLATALDRMKAKGKLEDQQGFKLLVDRLANAALKRASADKMPGLGHGANDVGITEFNHAIRDHILDGKPGLPPLIQKMKDHHDQVAGKTPAAPGTSPSAPQPNAPAVSAPSSVAPAGAIPAPVKAAPAPTLPSPGPAPQATGPTPQAPGAPSNTPKAFPPHVQSARAVAGRAVGRPTSKAHVDAYGKLSKADFDMLDSQTQRTIRDDLANAKAKFLDPKKSQAAQDLLDRFGSRHTGPTPAPVAGAKPTHVDDVKVGDTFTDSQGTYVITETPRQGKIKGFRMTSTAHGGREVLATEAQVARDFGIGRGPRTPSAPSGPAPHPKGYSDPQQQVVKAVTSGMTVTDDVLKAVARLSPATVGQLDDGDKKAVLSRLAFIATHPKATAEQRAKATAYGRMINKGSPAQTSRKWDHTPSLGELHTEEKTSGTQEREAALKAASATTGLAPGTTAHDRVKALSGLTRAQFDALPADEQRQITDALHKIFRDYSRARTSSTGHDPALESDIDNAVKAYTGLQLGLHLIRQSEDDYKAGKLDAEELHNNFLTARVEANANRSKADHEAVDKEAARIARDNVGLPTYIRATMVGEPKYGDPGYSAISMARMKHMWEPAPRLSSSDISAIFRNVPGDLTKADPIHAEAVRDLQENVLMTGLRGQPGVPSGSPWSTATRNQVVTALLGGDSIREIPADRLAAFRALPPGVQGMIRTNMRQQLRDQTRGHAKTRTWIALRELDGEPPLRGTSRDAILAAAESGISAGKTDAYRSLDPADYKTLPDFVRQTIQDDLGEAQQRAVRNAVSSPHTWAPTDNALKVFPAALASHLSGYRADVADRNQRNVTDIVNFGRDIVTPASRVETYNRLTPAKVDDLHPITRKDMFDDLAKIENDTALPLQTRYDAAMNGQVLLKKISAVALNPSQVSAVQVADPHPNGRYSDAAALGAFHNLSKADYDALSPAFRDAIDDRILTAASGPAQQILATRFHPAAVAQTPSGTVPTTVNPNVPPHVQDALDTLYGVHLKSHTMAHQLKTYGALRGSDFSQLNVQEQQQLLSDLSFIETTAKGPSADKARKLIDRFTPAGTPSGQTPPNPAIIPPANSVPGQVRYATPLVGTLVQAKDKGKGGDGWVSTPSGKRVWGKYGAAGLLLMHQDPGTGEKRYLMVQRGPGISDPGKWQFPGGAIDEKESFHQGGAREVIEELGFKDADLKTAAVHGEHTSSIPGSSWKYVSIAAQVPQMLKPDLSSHHAQLETSDAKWMTEAEIKALDTSGKLLAPLAGGKLEQNVMSLFPATSGQTLGQVARPGPIQRRLKRLTMPAGGRQAPAQFNAWPHAHKQSKGKNLMVDDAAKNKLRQDVKHARVAYDGKTGDGRLAAIGAMQGYDDTPTVVTKAEMDRLLATGDYIEAWRGVRGNGGWSSHGPSAAKMNEDMRSGPAWYGRGIFGNGYYLATQKSVATKYADGTKNSVVRILIPKTAIMASYKDMQTEARRASSRTSKAKGKYEDGTLYDAGRYAAAKGVDGIEIKHDTVNDTGGWARHVAAPGKPAFNWLNRSVLIIQEADK